MAHARKHPSIQEAEILGWMVPSSWPPILELELELELEREAHVHCAPQRGNLNWKKTMVQTHLQN